MSDTTLRLRGICDRHFHHVVVAVVVLVALSGGVTYETHVDPARVPEERVVSTWETTGEFSHRATVTEDNSVFRVGTSLEDRPAYFSRITPVLNGTFTFRYDAASADGVTVDASVTRVLRSVEGETVYWSDVTPLGSVTAEGVAPGEPVEAPFSTNISALEERIGTIESELGASPGETEVVIRVEVELTGTIAGESTDHRMTVRLPIVLAGGVYMVQDPGMQGSTIERTETVMVVQESGPLQRYGGPILLLLALTGLIGIVAARYRGLLALTEAERDYLQYRDDRSEFDEWITRIDLPEEAFDRPTALAASLGDLVDYAIDTDSAVVENPDGGEYYVVGEDYLYHYSAPSLGRDSML